MNDLHPLVKLLCERPELSAACIGRKADFCSRTVGRYRKKVAERDLPWSYYEPLSVEQLDLEFNKPRYRPPSKTPYDPDRVAAFLARPKATLRDAWEDYRASAPRPHLAYDTFRRRVGETLVRHYVAKDNEALESGRNVPFVTPFVPAVTFLAKPGVGKNHAETPESARIPGAKRGCRDAEGECRTGVWTAKPELARLADLGIGEGRLMAGDRTD
jgi:hypothetical protein